MTRAELMRRLERKCAQLEAAGEHRKAKIITYAIVQWADHKNPAFIEHLDHLKCFPVTIEEFATSPEFMGDKIEVLPTVWPDLIAANPDVFTGEEPKHEVLLGGATNTGKTFLATVTPWPTRSGH